MWKRYLSPTPANVARIMLIVKGALAIFIGSEMGMNNYKMATYGAIVGFILQELANFLTEKKGLLEDKNLREDDAGAEAK